MFFFRGIEQVEVSHDTKAATILLGKTLRVPVDMVNIPLTIFYPDQLVGLIWFTNQSDRKRKSQKDPDLLRTLSSLHEESASRTFNKPLGADLGSAAKICPSLAVADGIIQSHRISKCTKSENHCVYDDDRLRKIMRSFSALGPLWACLCGTSFRKNEEWHLKSSEA